MMKLNDIKSKFGMLKKIVPVVLSLLFMILFVACGSETGTMDSKTKAGEETQTDFQSEAAKKDAQAQKNKDAASQVTYWLNRHGEIYDSDFAPAGLDETFSAILWLSTHEGEIMEENVSAEGFPCIAESEKVLEATAEGEDVWNMLGAVSQVWGRIEQEPVVASDGSFGQVHHKDCIIYREGEDACVGWQSVEDEDKWTISRIAGYGDWLEKELGIFIRMTTGLGLQEAYEPVDSLPDGIPEEFWFCSGAGGWETILSLQTDGSFTGRFEDADAGTVYYCDFSGKFSDFRKVNDYTYAMVLTEFEATTEPGKETVRGGTQWVGAEPYGFDDDGREYLFYLPDEPKDELDEDFLSWANGPYDLDRESKTLDHYGIYDRSGTGKYGFVSYPE